MWGNYTRFKGVRIKVRSDLFSDFCGYKESEDGFIPYGMIEPIATGLRNTLDNQEIMLKEIDGPFSINYCDESRTLGCMADNTALIPGLDEPQVLIDMLNVGNSKPRCWSYEKEWRFKVSPFSKTGGGVSDLLENDENKKDMREAFFIPMRYEIEEILLGPETTDNDYDGLDWFLRKNNVKVDLRKSSIKLRNMG
jgi:hypothetical protein